MRSCVCLSRNPARRRFTFLRTHDNQRYVKLRHATLNLSHSPLSRTELFFSLIKRLQGSIEVFEERMQVGGRGRG